MARLKFRQLIDMAIGCPEPGHVNFCALHCALSCISEKLNIIDETVDISKYEGVNQGPASNNALRKLFERRLDGGADVEDSIQENSKKNADEIEAQTEIPTLAKYLEVVKETSIAEPVEMATDDSTKAVSSELGVIKTQTTAAEMVSPTNSEKFNKNNDEVLCNRTSSVTKKIDNFEVLLHNLDDRISKVEEETQKWAISKRFSTSMPIMKDQLQVVIEQLLLLTYLTLSKKTDSQRVRHLLGLAQTLHACRNENVSIEESNMFTLPTLPSIDWLSIDLPATGEIPEDTTLETVQSCSTTNLPNQCEPESCLCYSPEKVLDQLMELKGEFCTLTIKVNELSAKLVKQECQQTLSLIQDLQEQIRVTKLNFTHLKDQQNSLMSRVANNSANIENTNKCLDEIVSEKVDRAEMEILLADKADYNQLQRKVSVDQLLEVQCRFEKRFSEVFRQINENDKKSAENMATLRQTLGFAAIEGLLETFKQQVANEIHSLQRLLQQHTHSTSGECASAGGRVKVLQNLACLSCDASCVMHTMDKSKLAKLPNVRTSPSLAPLVTYELGSIRKSGIMGYYRKDDFPHAPHSWLSRQDPEGAASAKQIVPRHAGGQHTASSAWEHVEKVTLNRKQRRHLGRKQI